MAFAEKVREAIQSKAVESAVASITVLFVWAMYQLAPVILPAIEGAASKQVLLALVLSSFGLNAILVLLVWSLSKNEPFRLKYGIYWDKEKNPHCPSCKTPVAAYGNYQSGGRGYYCKPCKKVFPLADAAGNNINPEQVIAEL